MDAIILAAGLGTRLYPYTRDIPKCLLQVGNMTILERQILNLRRAKVNKIYIVIGHGADKIKNAIGEWPDIEYIFNPIYNSSNVIMSLMMALPYVSASFYCFCADCVFDYNVLSELTAKQADVVLGITQKSIYNEEAMKVNVNNGKVSCIGRKIAKTVNGEYIGLAAIYSQAVPILKQQVAADVAAGKKDFFFGDVINDLINNYELRVNAADMTGKRWCEIDYEEDLLKARTIFTDKRTAGDIICG